MDNCIFCKIGKKQIPSNVIYENDELMAFHDINPAAPIHFLIIPKQHIATLADCDDSHAALLGRMALLGKRLADEQGCGVTVDADGNRGGGYKTLFNTGPDGGQEVYHLHLHIIGGPRPWRGQR
ncbi:MAG: histidine triad nucleotide-binding protein [Burkholderiaceae bacterium]